MGTIKMTMPNERYNAVIRAEQFLKDLCDPKKTPRVPKEFRKQAYYCLRHYPSKHHMDVAENANHTTMISSALSLAPASRINNNDQKTKTF
jgi:hypothetical protein